MSSLVFLLLSASLGNAATTPVRRDDPSCPSVNNIGSRLVDDTIAGGSIFCTYSSDANPCTYFTDGSFVSGSSNCPHSIGETATSPICPPTPFVCSSTDLKDSMLVSGFQSTFNPTFLDCIYLDNQICTYSLSDGHKVSGTSVCPQSVTPGSGGSSSTKTTYGYTYTDSHTTYTYASSQPTYTYGSSNYGSGGNAAAVKGELADSAADSRTGNSSSAPSPAVIALLSLNGVLVLGLLVIGGVWLAYRRARIAKRPNGGSRYETVESASVPLTHGTDERYSDAPARA
ncbi:hypothetical protein FB451DRAFT_1565600 [Mycena latifolia]|nr:hypothetical protein FB451DRAFT_1565600 [Mycena latifolia]